MTDLDDLRTRLRNAGRPEPATGESYAHIYLGALAMLGFVVGAAAVLFVPTLSPTQPPADFPHFQSAQEGATIQRPPAPAATGLDYSADPKKLADAADSTCQQRAQTRDPSHSGAPRLANKPLADFDLQEFRHASDLMTCLLTEQPVRYCDASQKDMIAAEIVSYFRAVEHLNATSDKAPGQRSESGPRPQPTGSVEPDVRVIAAIEARLRDGLLTRADFDRFKSILPARLRERLAAVPVGTSHCPAPPWWAFWR